MDAQLEDPANSPSPVVTVFDLDGVIARGDTMEVLVRRMLVRNPVRAILAVPVVVMWFLIPHTVAWRGRLSGVLASIAFSGLTERRYTSLARRVGSALGSEPRWTLAEGARLLRAELDSGRTVVVSTGTEREIAGAFLDAIGFGDVSLTASTMRFGRFWVRYGNHNWGSAKVDNLAGPPPALFYTDSAADLPLARVAGRTVLVNPSPASEVEFRRTIPGVSVLRWP